jgi:adenylyltransferase/sulfurtransferase
MAKRYDAQIRVEEIGLIGQQLISKAKVLIIGAGGLGTPVATYLAAAGIGVITLVDGDKVSVSNLHRQWQYTEGDAGKNKSELLKQKLIALNPEVQINAYNTNLTRENADDLIATHDIVCDCTDNVDARLLSDAVCFKNGKPLVYAAVVEWIGYLTILNYKNKIRLTDIFPEKELREHSTNNCGVAGIVSTTCGILGSMQACEVLKLILNCELSLDGALLCVDSLRNTQRVLKIKTNGNLL